MFEAQAHGHPEGVLVKMQCYTAKYKGVLKPESEIEEMAWLTWADWQKTSSVDRIIFDWLKKRDLLA